MKWLRWMSYYHRLIGLVVGVQLLFWTVSGFFFTLFPIEVIHGDHLKQDAFPVELVLEGLSLVPFNEVVTGVEGAPERVVLKAFLDGPVYEVTAAKHTALFDAQTGAKISPLDEVTARRIAVKSWAGDGELSRLVLLDEAPHESGLSGGAWRADFAGKQSGTFYINPDTGHLRSVRTGAWRVFDFMWGLHIMNWTTREGFSTWWMKLFSFAAVTLTLLGIGILIDQARRGRLFK